MGSHLSISIRYRHTIVDIDNVRTCRKLCKNQCQYEQDIVKALSISTISKSDDVLDMYWYHWWIVVALDIPGNISTDPSNFCFCLERTKILQMNVNENECFKKRVLLKKNVPSIKLIQIHFLLWYSYHFNSSIVNFPYLCSNIPTSPAYGVYISQQTLHVRACSKVVSVFSWKQSTDEQVDVKGVSTVLFTDSFSKVLRSLQQSYLPIQSFFGPNAFEYVSYKSLSLSWH
jgi:hypothetical protein